MFAWRELVLRSITSNSPVPFSWERKAAQLLSIRSLSGKKRRKWYCASVVWEIEWAHVNKWSTKVNFPLPPSLPTLPVPKTGFAELRIGRLEKILETTQTPSLYEWGSWLWHVQRQEWCQQQTLEKEMVRVASHLLRALCHHLWHQDSLLKTQKCQPSDPYFEFYFLTLWFIMFDFSSLIKHITGSSQVSPVVPMISVT